MALFLVQHGVSESKDVDPEKGLSRKGRAETERIGQVAAGYAINVNRIVHSGKKRAEQTALIFHDLLSVQAPLEMISGIKPLDDVRKYAETLDPHSNLMVVGHLPFLQRLVSFMLTGGEDNLVYKFQNSGIVCLDAETGEDGAADWFIKWTLNPNIT
ncbi:phosphohistidine phosphatase SixA [Desulfogranum marinum]|uniref:phosphohistidine phosphatase SixA n=1 Tax=Desulfogranum marinum TaxID=453220 RepID=UPI0019660EFA|nr:phosphohistidine phosphatase SixA [Desulfogranum marinum]MBM9510912.1 phosphohistidine phosphatase SixA [Desulfogranum marinum]